MYSIESIRKNDHRNCWDQHVITRFKWLAKMDYFNYSFLRKKDRHWRIREF